MRFKDGKAVCKYICENSNLAGDHQSEFRSLSRKRTSEPENLSEREKQKYTLWETYRVKCLELSKTFSVRQYDESYEYRVKIGKYLYMFFQNIKEIKELYK